MKALKLVRIILHHKVNIIMAIFYKGTNSLLVLYVTRLIKINGRNRQETEYSFQTYIYHLLEKQNTIC